MTGDNSTAAARQLGAFLRGASWESVPAALQEQAKVRLLDALGSMFVGHDYEVSGWARRLAQYQSYQSGPSSYWMTDLAGSAQDCAFVNSVLIHSPLMDDTMAWSHPACNVIPSAIAVGEAEDRPGADVLTAIALGYEVQYRVAPDSVGQALFDRGLRGSAAPGAFGAAAAAAYLLDLSETGMGHAMALAASLCVPGIEEAMTYGTSERGLHMGTNTKNGVLAALLARAGFDSGPTALEGKLGFYRVYAGQEAPPELTAGLGSDWNEAEIRFKVYPTPFRSTFSIYSAEKLLRQHPVRPEEIEKIKVRIVPWGHNTGYAYSGPYTQLGQGIGSAVFGVAATLAFGRYDFSVARDAIGNPEVDSLAARTEISGVEPPGGYFDAQGRVVKFGEVELRLTDGRTIRADAADMPDELIWPAWDGEVTKFRRLTHGFLREDAREQIIAEIGALDECGSCRALARLLRTSLAAPTTT